jgi:hypothetical protein
MIAWFQFFGRRKSGFIEQFTEHMESVFKEEVRHLEIVVTQDA